MRQETYERFSDEHLVEMAQQGDRAAVETLVLRYTETVKNFFRTFFFKKYEEDLQGELWIAFLELIQVYPIDERSFHEMVINRLYFRRLNYYRKEKKRQEHEFSYEEWDDARVMERNEVLGGLHFEELRKYLSFSGSAERIIEAIESGAMTQTGIAKQIGISPQSVRETILKLRDKAHRYQKISNE